jgi:hypothetical protein
MTDLTDARWMAVKAALFLVIGAATFALLLLPQPTGLRVGYQVLMIWAFCRAYYFVFYVIEHYVDPTYRFSGLLDFARHVVGRKKPRKKSSS